MIPISLPSNDNSISSFTLCVACIMEMSTEGMPTVSPLDYGSRAEWNEWGVRRNIWFHWWVGQYDFPRGYVIVPLREHSGEGGDIEFAVAEVEKVVWAPSLHGMSGPQGFASYVYLGPLDPAKGMGVVT